MEERKHNFKNMVDYARENLDDFSKCPFNEVDSLVLSWLSYFHFHEDEDIQNSCTGISIVDAYKAEYFNAMLDDVWSADETILLLAAVVASPRYRNMRLLHYCNQLDAQLGEQFAAVTFQLTKDLYYVAYRGTDWTLTGWKEDCKLSLTEPVPSQKMAVKYINQVAPLCQGDLIVGGHSKGGNLAVYASAFCQAEIQERILAVYSHDGPGFSKEELEQKGFKRISHKLHKTFPQFSVFGMLFEQECQCRVVKSHENGIMQHNSMSWEIKGNHLVEVKRMSLASSAIQQRLNNWIDTLNEAERKLFIDTLFNIIEKTGESSFDEMKKNLKQDIPVLLQSVEDMDPEMRQFMLNTIRLLMAGVDLDHDEY